MNIEGNKSTEENLSLGVKMKGDYLRYVKFTNDKPEGTYLGSMITQ